MQILKLLNAVAAVGAGTVFPIDEDVASKKILQAIITGTATVKLQGSLNNVDWVDVGTAVSVSGYQLVDVFPYMRGNVTAWTSGTVTLLLDADRAGPL